MEGKIDQIVGKLEDAGNKAVDFVVEHPVKTLVVMFVVAQVIKWLKEK